MLLHRTGLGKGRHYPGLKSYHSLGWTTVDQGVGRLKAQLAYGPSEFQDCERDASFQTRVVIGVPYDEGLIRGQARPAPMRPPKQWTPC